LNRAGFETWWHTLKIINSGSDFECLAFCMSSQFEFSVQLFHSFMSTVEMMGNRGNLILWRTFWKIHCWIEMHYAKGICQVYHIL
jgi:hypothetical protein